MRSMVFSKWCRSAVALFLALGAASWGAAASAQENPWAQVLQRAVVRIEVPKQGEDAPSVGTGFIVAGKDGEHYVVTSTHVVLPDAPDVPPSEKCSLLLKDTQLFQFNRGDSELRGR